MSKHGVILLIACLEVVSCLESTPKTLSVQTTKSVRSSLENENNKSSASLEPTSTELTTLFTTCEFNNGSCSDGNTTIESNTTLLITTPTPKNVSKIVTKVPSKEKTKIKPKKDFLKLTNYDSTDLCICNLQLDACDLNCCCDPDCSYEDKLVFGHCEPEFRNYDKRFCDYMEYIYINNTGHEWEVNQNGLFCIVRSNLPPTYTVQRKHPLKNIVEAQFQKGQKYSWPAINNSFDTSYSGEKYKYGSDIWFLQNATLEKFRFYKKFITNHCVTKEDVKYLMDVDQSCVINPLDEYHEVLLHAENYFKDILVISSPSRLNVSSYEKGCPKNDCIEIETQSCNQNFENCRSIPLNFTGLRAFCKCNSTNYSCNNVVQESSYIFEHNGTQGIKKVKLKLILSNVTFDSCNGPYALFQHSRIQFAWFGHKLNYSSHLSGNPGYLSGKPILIANLITELRPINSTKNSVTNRHTNYTVISKLYRDPLDFSGNFMSLPENVDGECKHDRHNYLPIDFGYDLYSTCNLQEISKYTKNVTAKSICQKIQYVVFQYWNINATNNSLNNIFVGQFGNANAYRTEEWSSLLFKQDLNDVLNNVWGNFSTNNNQTVQCGNITTGLSIEFFHSRIDFEKIINQAKILGTTVTFENFKDMSFPCKSQDYRCDFNIRITSKIMFFDITQKKIKKIVDPPSFRIRLPHDFFYPFVKINNKAYGLKSSLIAHFVVFCMFIIF